MLHTLTTLPYIIGERGLRLTPSFLLCMFRMAGKDETRAYLIRILIDDR